MRLPCLLLLLALAGCAGSGLHERPTTAMLIAQFEAVAFGNDHGEPAGILIRWSEAPTIRLLHLDAAGLAIAAGHGRDVDAVIGLIHRNTGLKIRPAAAGTEPTMNVVFMPQRRYAEIIANATAPEARLKWLSDFFSSSQCYGLVGYGRNENAGVLGRALLAIDSESPPDLRLSCVHEEIIQSMGLPADACHYRPSLFCELDRTQLTTEADEVLLRTLYDSRLAPGMTPAQAMPLARRIIRDWWGDESD